jgi:hypothetical protein
MRMDRGGQFKQNRVFKLPAFVFVCSGLWAETRRRLMRQPLVRQAKLGAFFGVQVPIG